jgi:Ca2+-transporting ATPase
MTSAHPALTGLSEAEAAARLAADGPNTLPQPERRTPWRICAEVLREPMFALLLAGAALYVMLGEAKDAAVLLGFASLSVSIAIVQEMRSERVLDALRELSSPAALVIRDGLRRRIPSRELVRGDLFVVAEGDRVPADGRVLEAGDLHADESLLTGESVPVAKAPADDAGGAQDLLLDQPGRVFAGSLVVRGTGLAEVVAIGGRTQMGRIGAALEGIRPEAGRLTQQTRRLVRGLGLFALLVCVAVVLTLGLRRHDWLDGLLGGVATGMAMIPEEFPLVLAVFMVMGAWRISRAGVLTRKAAAIETLGSATVLCADKTGTLTQNRMTVVAGWRDGANVAASDPVLAELVRVGVLASAIDPFDPMERAFHQAADRPPGDAGDLVQSYGLRPDLLAVTQVWADAEGRRQAAAKGAPEAIVDLCGLTGAERDEALAAARTLAERGTRVLGLAAGPLDDAHVLPETPHALGLRFAGLIGLADPVRPDVPDAVRACREAGIRVVMITGDHPATARAVADAAGLGSGDLITGPELAAMSDEALAARIRSAMVFARTLPEQKLRIVQALKAAGEVVAMTGDGVNDAPALKAADIGVAMGERGSDVAREAASLVLLKDGFGPIVETVRLGRRIYDNLRHSMGFIIAVHLPIAGMAVIPLIGGGVVLLGPMHIAFLEMFIDPVCAIAFEAEPADPDIMRRPPRDPEEPLFSARTLALAAVRGLIGLVMVLAVWVFMLWRSRPADSARAAAFAALVAVDLALVVASRVSPAGPLAALSRRNPTLWALAAGLIALLAAVLATPLGRALFDFGPVEGIEIAAAAAAGLATLAVSLLLSPGRARAPARGTAP